MNTSNSSTEHKHLKCNGYNIHYYTSGEKGKDLLFFLHPAFADHRCFYKQIDFFSENYRVITIDMLGHGLSSIDKAKDKIDSTIEHINSIMELEGYSKAHFAGVSMGTLIAQYFALHHPEKVSSLTILGGYDINADNKVLAKAQRSEQFKWMFKAIVSMKMFRRYLASVSVINKAEQKKFFKMASMFKFKSFMAMSGLSKVIQSRETEKRPYPILILSGDQDLEIVHRMSKQWHTTEPESKFAIIPTAGHCANMDNADEFNKVLMEFIQKI